METSGSLKANGAVGMVGTVGGTVSEKRVQSCDKATAGRH